MGVVYQAQGKYDQALTYYEKAIKIDLETIGNNHPETKRHIRNKEICERKKANR
jgi:tetratricopeptide (TPR) repeat protein